MDIFLIVKACHIISVIAWMAGLFYLPRLFVYHATAAIGSELSETFKIMERRLFRAIMGPAMMLTWSFGLWLLILNPGYLWQPWFWVKAAAVLGLTWFQHILGRMRVAFAEDRNQHPAKTFRLLNEVPTLAVIVIVLMVILKPF